MKVGREVKLGQSAGHLPCGDLRIQAALAGYFRCGTSAGCREAGGRSRPYARQKMLICRDFTGATGLEPATSGVTGLFYRYDDWLRLTRYRSIHAGLRAFGLIASPPRFLSEQLLSGALAKRIAQSVRAAQKSPAALRKLPAPLRLPPAGFPRHEPRTPARARAG
jgi:hypothetical protein